MIFALFGTVTSYGSYVSWCAVSNANGAGIDWCGLYVNDFFLVDWSSSYANANSAAPRILIEELKVAGRH